MMKLLVLAAIAVARPVHARGCHEISHVVGYEHCNRFGAWSRDEDILAFTMEFGWVHHDYEARPFTLSGQSTTGSLATEADAGAWRTLIASPIIYGGLELQLGGLSTQPELTGLPSSGSAGALLGIVGAHGSMGRFAGALELAAGGRYTFYCYDSTRTCPVGVTQNAAELEARARVDVFFGSTVSFAFAYGHSLVDRDDHSVFLIFGFHRRPNDGMY
jgi:hypothetical protein